MTYINIMNCCGPSDKHIVIYGRPVWCTAFVTQSHHSHHISPPTQTSLYGLFNVALPLFQVREPSEASRSQYGPWRFNNNEFYILPKQCVFCIYLRTNSDLCHLQHKLIGFYNRDLTLNSPVVTICTASLTFNNSTFCPHSVFMSFCVDLRTNSHYFPIQQ